MCRFEQVEDFLQAIKFLWKTECEAEEFLPQLHVISTLTMEIPSLLLFIFWIAVLGQVIACIINTAIKRTVQQLAALIFTVQLDQCYTFIK
jgi:uncharacterized membrane protein